MGTSTVVEWLNENEMRAYPLTVNSARFYSIGSDELDLYRVILDANFVYRTTLPTDIALVSVTRNDSVLTFKVTDLPDFTLDLSTATYPAYVRNTNDDLLVIGAEVSKIANIDNTASISFDSVYFEPCIAIELTGICAGVKRIAFNSTEMPPGALVINEGYQTSIQVNKQVIRVKVGRNEGIPLGCENFFESELGDQYDCDIIVSSVNGATPRETGAKLYLNAGDHVKIYEDSEKGKIFIGLDFDPADICAPVILPPQQTV